MDVGYTKFYDAAGTLSKNIPSNSFAAVYVNGSQSQWTCFEIARMFRVVGISVYSDPSYAKYARIIDVETHAATPGDVPAFIRTRRSLGHQDATVYCNRTNWYPTWKIVHDAGLSCRWWIATWDGNTNPTWVNGVGAAPFPWAVQYQATGSYDLSVLKGVNDFGTPGGLIVAGHTCHAP